MWIKFKGGKGVATSAGVCLGLAPVSLLLAMAVTALRAESSPQPSSTANSSSCRPYMSGISVSNPSVTSSLIGNPYMFTGRRWDEETEIYYYRARMYSSSLGRFLQRDPIGILGGINLYGYVGNSPINYTDAYGLLNPNGQWPLYKKKDYEKGKKKLKEEMKKKYPWMSDKDLDKRADDIMREMTIPEAKRLDDFGKKGKEKEAEDLVKDICERTGANCDPQEPKEDEACEPQQ